MPERERYLWVCTNRREEDNPKGSCARAGSAGVLEKLKALVVERHLQSEVRVCGSTCLDFCAHGVTVAVMPDRVFYGHVTEADVPEIVDSLSSGGVVERLVLKRADLAHSPAKGPR